MLPTIEEIKSKYPDVMTADHNLELVENHNETVSVFDPYPNCNYCIGGALQMAFGETSPDDVDNWRDGIFPAPEDLADTLHYFCKVPYGSGENEMLREYPCLVPHHEGQDCFTNHGETAYSLADEITRANDRGDFDYAWSCVELVLKDVKI